MKATKFISRKICIEKVLTHFIGFENLKRFSEHMTIERPEGRKNLPGVWVEGTKGPVRILQPEFKFM